MKINYDSEKNTITITLDADKKITRIFKGIENNEFHVLDSDGNFVPIKSLCDQKNGELFEAFFIGTTTI